MARKITNPKMIVSLEDQIKQCTDFLSSNGYGVFTLESCGEVDEAVSRHKLELLGYKVEHMNDALVKIDPKHISSADDIVLYFYEKLRRLDRKKVDPKKMKDKKCRLVDCSVINNFIKWRLDDSQTSLADAISELFIAIDTLFEKSQEWNLDIRGIGILSITTNKPFILSLLREVHLKQDRELSYQIETLRQQGDLCDYPTLLALSREEMKRSVSLKAPKINKRKIKARSDA